jgi:hypothetical protein
VHDDREMEANRMSTGWPGEVLVSDAETKARRVILVPRQHLRDSLS